jgi:hypothetical protein
VKIINDFELGKTNEDLKTSIFSIFYLPPSARHELYKSVEGKQLIKGLRMIAENAKPDTKRQGVDWTPEEIEELNEAIITASPEDREILVSLVPSPVMSILHDRMNQKKTEPYGDWVKIKGASQGEGGRTDISKGAKVGTPGYDAWVEKIRAKRAGGSVSPDAMTRPTKYKPGNAKSPKNKKYKHFIRRVKKDAKIVDTKTSEKSEKSY